MARKYRQEDVTSSVKYMQKMYERLIKRGVPPEVAMQQAAMYATKRALKYGGVLLLKKIAQKLAKAYNVPRQQNPIIYAYVNEVARALLEMGEEEDIAETVHAITQKHLNRMQEDSNLKAYDVIRALDSWFTALAKPSVLG